MATISTTISTNHAIYMSFPQFVAFDGSLTATSSNFSWNTPLEFVNATDVDIHGSGFTYTGSGDARELASGTISRISIDVYNDNGSETNGDLVITGTEGLIAANIDKDDPRKFWNEVLKGDDVFLLSGLAEVDIGFDSSTIFGDDFASDTISTPGVISDQGGDDTIIGADNVMHLIGDVRIIEGFDSGEFGFFPAEYDAGNDHILSAITDREVTMFGDASFVETAGILHGGDDVLNNSKSTNFFSNTVGDAHVVNFGGTVYGGNDSIDTSSNPAARGAHASGDAGGLGEGTVIGGDDEIVAHGPGDLSGDVGSLALHPPSKTAYIDGGNDRLIGSGFDDRLSGDVGQIGQFEAPFGTLLGGDDIISGGAGNDELYGEYGVDVATHVSGGAVSGGNDQLDGGEGNDRLLGQTGVDTLHGGEGNDRLNGGRGLDQLRGELGDDTYIVNAAGEATEALDQGIDTVLSTVSYALGDNLERLLLVGGNNIAATGNALGNLLIGNTGNNTLTGGVGRDVMIGGAGDDTYDFNALAESGLTSATRDRIVGFGANTNLDRIDLASIDAVPGGADNVFNFRGTAAFTAAGQIRTHQSGSDTIVAINTAGTNGAEATILLVGITASTIEAGDFIL